MHYRIQRLIHLLLIVMVAAITMVSREASAQESFEGWNLEPGVGQAHLVMVARVASISRLTVVEGAKTDVALREYRFQPIRRLKGIFQRDQLSMTASDLGCAADDPAFACPLKEGEFRLLILALPYKLRVARLLARHKLADGYALATEHLADAAHTAQATQVLVALEDARTVKELSAIIASRPDRRWHAAALEGLVAIGDAPARKQLLEILADDRHPLAADAAEAVGLVSDADLLRPLATLVQSRNKHIAMTALVALRRFFTGVRSTPRGLAAADQVKEDPDHNDPRPPVVDVPAQTRAAIVSAVTSLVVDPYVEANVRLEAFAVARLLRGDRYAKLLADLADQAELEGTPLLTAVETELRLDRKGGQ